MTANIEDDSKMDDDEDNEVNDDYDNNYPF